MQADGLQTTRHVAPVLAGRLGRLGGGLPGQAGVEERAQCPDVRGGADVGAGGALLGRLVIVAVRPGEGGEAEIGNLRFSVAIEENATGSEIAMQHATDVTGMDSACQRLDKPGRLQGRQRSGRQALRQTGAIQPLHRHEWLVVGLADCDNLDNVGVAQGGGHVQLGAQTHQLRSAGALDGEEPERNQSPGRQVACPVDRTVSAAAARRQQFEAADARQMVPGRRRRAHARLRPCLGRYHLPISKRAEHGLATGAVFDVVQDRLGLHGRGVPARVGNEVITRRTKGRGHPAISTEAYSKLGLLKEVYVQSGCVARGKEGLLYRHGEHPLHRRRSGAPRIRGSPGGPGMVVPRLRAPIVLAHGILGFDHIRLGRWVLSSYFHRVPEALQAGGNRVLVARVSATDSIAARAAQLVAFLDRHCPHEPVHIIGHSMGGLDARYAICRLGLASRVLSLTSVGTPHRGSPFADWGVRRFERILLRPFFWFVGLPYSGFRDLTVEHMAQFNKEMHNARGVRYFSVAGRFGASWRWPEWQLPFRIVQRAEGDNDGVVSVASATWGESLEVWEDADHLNLINWRRALPFLRRQPDRADHYVRLVRRLADEGF